MDTFAATELACVRGERLVFTGVGFAIASGGALLVRGPNGTGKSSLLRVCAGFVPASAGQLTWNGRPVTKEWDAQRARTTYVGHLDAVKPAFTVAENLGFWASLGGRTADAGALAPLALDHLHDLPAAYLSAGQKRRLNLSRLSVSTAALWLLDEPTSSLDDVSTAALLAVLAAHQARGGMAIIATHHDLPLPNVSVLRLGPA